METPDQPPVGSSASARNHESSARYGVAPRSSVSASNPRSSYVSNLGRAVLRDHLGKRERGQLARHEDVLRDFAGGRKSGFGGGTRSRVPAGDELDSLLSNFVDKRNEWA